MVRSLMIAVSLAGIVAGSGSGMSQSPSDAADRAAIQAVVDSESEAWNRGDAEAFAAH